jgi:hypothetical protein
MKEIVRSSWFLLGLMGLSYGSVLHLVYGPNVRI